MSLVLTELDEIFTSISLLFDNSSIKVKNDQSLVGGIYNNY